MRLLLIILAGACAAGCGTPSQVAFDAGGLKYESGGIGIAVKNPSPRQFIDKSWWIDNWAVDYSDPKRLIPKQGSPFEGTLRVDMDNDGREEDYSAFFTDLELRNIETEGRIWVLMRELPAHRAEVKLDVFVDDYTERLSFEQYLRTGPFDVWLLPTKKYAARVVSKQPTMLGPLEAMIATIEIANLAQLQLDPQSRMGFVRVMMVRVPGFSSNVFGEDGYALFPRSRVGLLVVGYYASTAYFEKGLADFEAFLGQFTVNGKPVKIERTAPPDPSASTPPTPSTEAP